MQRLAVRRLSSAVSSGRPGARRAAADEMADAAAAMEDKKGSWQKLMGGVVNAVRPACAALHPVLQPLLDAPAQRRVEAAVNIEALRVAATARAHAMGCGYLKSGADEER